MALKVVHDGEAPGALRENCCICRTKTNYWYEPKDIALCEHCAKTTKRVALPTKEEWCAKENAIFKQKNTHWMPMALSDDLEALAKRHGALSYRNRADTQNPAFGFSVAGLESLLAEVRKQDDALLQAALDALTCTGESDDPGHRCGHCDDYVDRNGQVRAALRARLEGKP